MSYYICKQGWNPAPQKIREIYNEVMQEAIRLGLWPADKEYPPIYVHKATKCLGNCWYRWVSGVGWFCSIALSSLLVDKCQISDIRKTIVHEVAHAICPGEHHNWHWKMTADRIGRAWGYTINRLSENEDFAAAAREVKAKSVYRYELYCPCCGATWKYKNICQAVKQPYLYKCGKCKENLSSREIGA